MTPGVYRMTCAANATAYVGSSCRCLFGRLKEHVRKLRVGKHENERLQRTWDKYGEEAFEVAIVEIVEPGPNLVQRVLRREQLYIDAVPAFARLNLTAEARTAFGAKLSEATRAKMSATRTGKPLSNAHRANVSAGWRDGRNYPPSKIAFLAKR